MRGSAAVESSRRDKRREKRRVKRGTKLKRHKSSSRTELLEDASEHESDLDLEKEVLAIGGYLDDRAEMVEQMFRSISRGKLTAMLPQILKPLPLDDLKRLCIDEVEVMSRKRVLRILDGENADAISSSGTDDSSAGEEEQEDAEVPKDEDNAGEISEADSGSDVSVEELGSEVEISSDSELDNIEKDTDDKSQEVTTKHTENEPQKNGEEQQSSNHPRKPDIEEQNAENNTMEDCTQSEDQPPLEDDEGEIEEPALEKPVGDQEVPSDTRTVTVKEEVTVKKEMAEIPEKPQPQGLTKPDKNLRSKTAEDESPEIHEINSDMEEGEIQSSSASEAEEAEGETVYEEQRVVKFLSLKEKQRLKRQKKYAIFEGTSQSSDSQAKPEITSEKSGKLSKLEKARQEVRELEERIARTKPPPRETIDHEALAQVDVADKAEEEKGVDGFFGAENFQEDLSQDDVSVSSDSSEEPDFDEVPDEREAMMLKRQELVRKQHIGKRLNPRPKHRKPGEEDTAGTTGSVQEGSVEHYKQIKSHVRKPLPKKRYKKQAENVPPSFDLENFMKSHTSSTDPTAEETTDRRKDGHGVQKRTSAGAREGIDVESFLRTQVPVCESQAQSQENSDRESDDGLGELEEDDSLDIRRVIMGEEEEEEPNIEPNNEPNMGIDEPNNQPNNEQTLNSEAGNQVDNEQNVDEDPNEFADGELNMNSEPSNEPDKEQNIEDQPGEQGDSHNVEIGHTENKVKDTENDNTFEKNTEEQPTTEILNLKHAVHVENASTDENSQETSENVTYQSNLESSEIPTDVGDKELAENSDIQSIENVSEDDKNDNEVLAVEHEDVNEAKSPRTKDSEDGNVVTKISEANQPQGELNSEIDVTSDQVDSRIENESTQLQDTDKSDTKGDSDNEQEVGMSMRRDSAHSPCSPASSSSSGGSRSPDGDEITNDVTDENNEMNENVGDKDNNTEQIMSDITEITKDDTVDNVENKDSSPLEGEGSSRDLIDIGVEEDFSELDSTPSSKRKHKTVSKNRHRDKPVASKSSRDKTRKHRHDENDDESDEARLDKNSQHEDRNSNVQIDKAAHDNSQDKTSEENTSVEFIHQTVIQDINSTQETGPDEPGSEPEEPEERRTIRVIEPEPSTENPTTAESSAPYPEYKPISGRRIKIRKAEPQPLPQPIMVVETIIIEPDYVNEEALGPGVSIYREPENPEPFVPAKNESSREKEKKSPKIIRLTKEVPESSKSKTKSSKHSKAQEDGKEKRSKEKSATKQSSDNRTSKSSKGTNKERSSVRSHVNRPSDSNKRSRSDDRDDSETRRRNKKPTSSRDVIDYDDDDEDEYERRQSRKTGKQRKSRKSVSPSPSKEDSSRNRRDSRSRSASKEQSSSRTKHEHGSKYKKIPQSKFRNIFSSKDDDGRREDRDGSRDDYSRSRSRDHESRDRSRDDYSRSRDDGSRSRRHRTRSRDRDRSRDDRSRDHNDRPRGRDHRSRDRDDRSRDRRSGSRRSRSKRRHSRSSRSSSRSRSRSHSRSRRRSYSRGSRSRSRSRRDRRSHSRSRSRSRHRDKSSRYKSSSSKHGSRHHYGAQDDWGHAEYRGGGRGRGRGFPRGMRRPFGRGGGGGMMRPFYPRGTSFHRGMGFYNPHRQYFGQMQRHTQMRFNFPDEVAKGERALSPLSKHLLLMHQHDSDSLDEDVEPDNRRRRNRRRDRRREENEEEEERSTGSEESDDEEEEEESSPEREVSRHGRRPAHHHEPEPSSSSSYRRQATRGATSRDRGHHRGHHREHHRGHNPRNSRGRMRCDEYPDRRRPEPSYLISDEEQADVQELPEDEAGSDVSESGSEGQMEILELEMRARAIKAMLKAQEELDKAERLRAQIKTKSPSAGNKGGQGKTTAKRKSDGNEPATAKKRATTASSSRNKPVRQRRGISTEGLSTQRQLAQEMMEEATASTSGQLHKMKGHK